jgi:Uma2 family endonuclease
MTIEEMKERKRELGYSYEQLAKLAGIPCSTVQKIFGGTTRSPRRSTIMSLEKILLPSPVGKMYISMEETASDHRGNPLERKQFRGVEQNLLGEPEGIYITNPVKKEKYSVADYFHFSPDRGRCELIDGVIYEMASPNALHQGMSLRLGALLLQYVDNHGGQCRVYTAPLDVIPDPADKFTVVQPDVMVICDPSKMRSGYCEGAPDLVVEILSPSTRRRDLITKHAKYAEAGVREYWIVDIDAQSVVVYDFEHEALPKICGFGTPLPVGIWGGNFCVDFSAILAKL